MNMTRDAPLNLDEQPGLMSGRNDPMPDFPMEQKLGYLNAIASAFGQSWIESPQDNPIPELWRRKDWLATSELLHFGHAIAEVRAKSGERWLRDHIQRIRAHDLQGARGSVFEITAASMFGTSNQEVDYAAPSQPGYDLVLKLPTNRQLRVSCKVLSASAYGRAFPHWGHETFRRALETFLAGTPVHITLTTRRPAAPTPSSDAVINTARAAISLCATTWGEVDLGPWRMSIRPLTPFSDAKFLDTKVSLGLTVLAPHGINEQKRFDDKIDEACRNLSRHAPPPNDEIGNVVLIKIPETVSLEAAISYAKAGPLQTHEYISGVLLFRSVVCSNGKDIGIGHQFKVVPNSAAAFPLTHYAPTRTLAVTLLTGVAIGAQPLQEPDAVPYNLPAPYCYTFERQHHHYTRTVPGKAKGARQRNVRCETPPLILGLSCSWTFFGPRRVDLRFEHCVVDRELVLL